MNGGGTTPERRRGLLKGLLASRPFVRILEAHSGLSGMIVEHTQVERSGTSVEFDGIWLSSLTDSTTKGKPDTEYVDLTSRLTTLHDILEVTTKPVIYDGDSGGLPEHFAFTVRTLERLGVSAVIIEDKTGPKKNSLFGAGVEQTQADIEVFSHKLAAGKTAGITDDFMIIARIESLILEAGMDDALARAEAFAAAGADGIMIHSKQKTADEILEFCERYAALPVRLPLVVVPSTYSQVRETELVAAGVRIVIYANQLLRSAYPAMLATAREILEQGRASEAEARCMSIDELINLIEES